MIFWEQSRAAHTVLNTTGSIAGITSFASLSRRVLDILVEPDLSYRILDVEDFERNAEAYSYSVEVKANAHRAVTELVSMIENHVFPFDS